MKVKELSSQIKAGRKSLGYSQAKLANLSHISLATLQNLEAGTARPELRTLEAIFAVIGLRLVLEPQPIDWDQLAAIGVPILQRSKRPSVLSVLQMLQILNQFAPQIAWLNKNTRDEMALASWLWAMHDHYPLVWTQVASPIHKWFNSRPDEVRSVKLRRLAIQQLSETF